VRKGRRLRPAIIRAAYAVAFAAALSAPAAARAGDLASYVDPTIGTAPPGFVFPGAAVPFGMVQNSPDTNGPFAYSGYLATDPLIRGFSLVHLSGPGVQKAGDVPFMPTISPAPSNNDPNVYGSTFSHVAERAEAGYYRVHLDQGTDVELTASTRAAMQRYTFPPTPTAGVLIDVSRSAEGVHDGEFRVTGPSEVSGVARGRYSVHFVARFSRPFTSTKVLKASGNGAAGWVGFDTATGPRTVTARIGISFVDEAGARRNLDAEAPNFDFDAMHARARAGWNTELGRAAVHGGTNAQLKPFYTALYHAMLHPNVFQDADGRYMGFDEKPHVAAGRTQYANFSLWDTYRAENQLLALLEPRRYRDMLRSLLDDARLGGKLPRWGEQYIDPAHMSGDPAVQMIADGVCRGLISRSDATGLYRASTGLVKSRPAELARYGYLPGKPGTTLEFGVADFSLALVADSLGLTKDARRWAGDSLRYRKLLDPSTHFVRPRNADGSFASPFDPTDEKGFQEGNSWQYSWLDMHDARGLFKLIGGDGAAAGRLDQMFTQPPETQATSTLEGTTYRTNQFAPGNEHDLEIPYLYTWARRPSSTATRLRTLQRLYRPSIDGLPGNDDLGSLSAWHVFNDIGFGPVTPGAPFYVIGSPAFDRVVLRPDGGAPVRLEAPGTSLVNQYVTGATLGGKPLGRAWLPEAALRGRTLRLAMGPNPSPSWATGAGDVPPSLSTSPLGAFGCSHFKPVPRSALRLRVAPRRVHIGRTTVLRVRVTASGRAAGGAIVRFGRYRGRTGRSGRVTMRVRVVHRGHHRVSASKRGMRSAATKLLAVR
jgi:predicted alpha-1,2-mannosidase